MFSQFFLKVIQSLKFLKQCFRMRPEAALSFYFKLMKPACQGVFHCKLSAVYHRKETSVRVLKL